MDQAQLLWVNFGVIGLLGAAGLAYLRNVLNASAERIKADAMAQTQRQSTEASFDQRLLKQLEERDGMLREERVAHAEEVGRLKQELLESSTRNRELNDRYYEQMRESMKVTAAASVAAAEHNVAIVRAVNDARAASDLQASQLKESTKRLHEKLEAQELAAKLRDEAHERDSVVRDAKLQACEDGHAQCSIRLAAIERLLHMRLAEEGQEKMA